MAGINFFSVGEDKLVKVVNLDGITQKEDFFKPLIGLELSVKPMGQFWYEYVGGVKHRNTEPIDGKIFYFFKVSHAIEMLEKEGKDATDWKELDPEMDATLLHTMCEVLQ